ncbi:TetR/AcrR family transcriptional regulator [Haloechinothrix salitolerans]
MAAVLAAATELLTESGPHDITVRRIAERAGVNHALAHRHFGTKEEIVRQALRAQADTVVAELAAHVAGSEPDITKLMAVFANYPTYWRSLAHVALHDPALAEQGAAPTTQLFVDLLRRAGDERAQVSAAVTASLMLGWLAFGDFVVTATGADRDRTNRAVATAVHELLERR